MRGVESAKAKIILYKCALYSVALFLVGVLQVTFFAKINVLDASPDLLLGAVTTLALYEDSKVSSICGIISGFLYCALGGFAIPFYIVFSFLAAYALWIIRENGLSKRHSSFLIMAILAFGAKALFNVAELSLSAQNFNLIGTLYRIIIPEFISSMLFSPISYMMFFALTRIFYKSNRQRKD
ncbi:MAG: hypothetical protein J6S23_07660 [Clostridia bacterium]|nr:hypothetical protein [Clostridia bacterium]